MKRIISIILIVCLVICISPVMDSDANAKSKEKLIKTTFGGKKVLAEISVVPPADDSLNEAKGAVKEYIDAVYDNYVMDESYYCAAVWKELNASYDKAVAMIDAMKRVKDLYTFDEIFVELNSGIENEIMIMVSLAGAIKHYVKGKNDLSKLVTSLKKNIKMMKADYRKKDYNDFYWGKLQNLFYDAGKQLENIKTFRDYIIISSEIENSIGSVSISSNMMWLSELITEDSGILIDLIPSDDGWIIIIDNDSSSVIYTKDDVELARLEVVQRLNLYVDNQLKMAGYKGDVDELRTQIADYKTKKLDKLEDVEAIVKAGESKLKAMIKKTGVKCPDLTRADFVKVANQYNELTSDYSQFDYSQNSWMMIETAFTTTKSLIENATKKYEVYGAISALKKELKQIPTAKKEFKDLKKKTKKKLKAYTSKKGRKKYVQSKAKVVVKQGLSALDKVSKYEVEELQEVSDKYIDKANKCIKKFRIRTSKKGKGSISKSKNIKYGGKYVVRITPKAGYKIKQVKIDGKKKKLKNKYTFKKIKKKHSVNVVFGK